MSELLAGALVVVAFAAGLAVASALATRRTRRGAAADAGTRRILLPFTGTSISRRSLEAAVRLARAENATIMPAFLAQVPRQLPLDAPLPSQCLHAMPLLEAIEQRAIAKGVSVDSRVGRGRTYRQTLSRVIEEEPVDRIIISATHRPRSGLSESDLQWLLQTVPAEIIILRPNMQDRRTIAAEPIEGHF